MIQRICQQCGVTYETYPAVKKRYCSNACAGAAKRKGNSITCEQCGAIFYAPPSQKRRFCSKSCARTALNLTDANPSYHRDLSGENNPMYGTRFNGTDNPMYGRRRALSPRWKGGRKVRKDGYILVVAPDDHPYPCDQHPASGLKYILEHRYVMEQHLGRYLLPTEVVHHIDENPSNNDIDNLRLFDSQAEHVRIGHSGITQH